jgi:ankyrin repeat protein
MFFGLALAQIARGCADPESPLAVAAAANNVSEIRRLLADGHLVNENVPNRETPLIAATRSGAVDAIRALLAAGADPDLPDDRSTRWPPIMHAIHTRQPGALQLLLEAGADDNARVGGGGSPRPLVMAAAEPDATYVKLLLEHGANPRADGDDGALVMAVATSGGALLDIDRPLLGGCHTETVQALLDHDPDLRNIMSGANHGGARAARWIARFHGCREVIELLEKAERHPPNRAAARPLDQTSMK